MAEFNVDLSPKNTGMSLGDLMKMGLYSAEMAKSRVQASQAAQEYKELGPVREFMSNPANYTTDGKVDPDKAGPVLMAIAPLTGPGHLEKLQTIATNQNTIADAKLNLTTKERTIFAQIDNALGWAKESDPNAYINAYKRVAQEYAHNPDMVKMAEAKINLAKVGGKGPQQWQHAIRSADTLMTLPEQNTAFRPQAGTGTIGGQTVQTVTTPSVEGSTPTVSATPIGGEGGRIKEEKPSGKLPKLIQEDESLNYKPSASGIYNPNDLQKVAIDTGDKYLKEANATVKNVKDLEYNIDKVEQYLSSASGSGLYQKLQAGGKWTWGNADFDSLVKNIAQLQARNATVMGLDKTDSSRDLNAKLSGSEKIDPKALAGIMQQVRAETTAAKLFTQGLNKFVEKRGDINGRIQAQKFQNAWSDAYDPRIFMVDNIAASNLPEKEKQNRIDNIVNKMTDDQYDKYKKDRVIIHSLVKGVYQ